MSRRTAQSAFTIVELLVSIGIFTLLSGVVLARYRTFDTNAKFANASEDVVLALRQAQVYGVGVKGAGSSFDVPYGVHFVNGANNIVLFADRDGDGKYTTADDPAIETKSWQNGISIVSISCGGGACSSSLDITFKRPNVDAIIADSAGSGYLSGVAVITNGAKTQTVSISNAGQISLQ